MAAYLEAALEEGDIALITAALGDIARAQGMWLFEDPEVTEIRGGPDDGAGRAAL